MHFHRVVWEEIRRLEDAIRTQQTEFKNFNRDDKTQADQTGNISSHPTYEWTGRS